jgi:hypothetical protein
MEQVTNNNQKSLLAKLLATENIIVQHQHGAKTASFDVAKRVLILPVWREMSSDLYDMMIVHEVGHALDTPADFPAKLIDMNKRLNGNIQSLKGFLNIIEDARIDKRQKRRFPGARRNYIKGYNELLEKNFLGTVNTDVNGLTFIDRVNIHFKAGAMSGVNFNTPVERAFVKRIETAETFDEVLALTEEIYAYAKEQKQEQQSLSQNLDDFSSDDDDEEYETDSSSSDSDYDFDDQEEEENDDDSDGEESSDADASDDAGEDDSPGAGDEGEKPEKPEDAGEDDSSDKKQAGDHDGGEGTFAKPEPDAPKTEQAWQEKQADLIANPETEYIYATLPHANLGTILVDYKQVLAAIDGDFRMKYQSKPAWFDAVRTELNNFKSSENAAISFMVKEFEMRKAADEYSRTSVSKTGVIDTNKLHSYRYNDDLFKRNAMIASGKSHGFVMIIDWSGSMDTCLKNTIKQLFSLVWFCKRVNIPFEVYSFKNGTTHDNYDKEGPCWSHKDGDIEMSTFRLRNLLSSRMNLADFNKAMYYIWCFASGQIWHTESMGSTPLNEAILASELVIKAFQARSKVQIVNTIFLTDGNSDGNQNVFGHKSNTNPDVKYRKFHITDDVTKKTYEIGHQKAYISHSSYYKEDIPITISHRVMTPTLLKILKDRTGTNLVGFFLESSKNFKFVFNDAYRNNMNYDDAFFEKQRKLWLDNGFLAVTSAGYDENYVINSKTLNIVNKPLEINSTMTKNKMAKMFLEHCEKKTVNRVLLQRFIKLIAA